MPETSPTRLLMRLRAVGLGVHQDVRRRLRHLGLTPGEFELMQILARESGMTAPVLERSLDVRRQSLREQLLSLEKRGLVVRHMCLGDTRSVAYSLTDSGKEHLEAGLRAVEHLELQLLGWLGRRDGVTLLRLLDKADYALRLARRIELDTDVEEDGVPPPLAEMYVDGEFVPRTR